MPAAAMSFGSLSPRHYLARATMPGYDESPVVTIGYLETSKTVDFELRADRIDHRTHDGDLDRPRRQDQPAAARPVTIAGTGFRSGTTVTFDAESTTAYVLNTTTIYAITPAHAAATVTVKVTSRQRRKRDAHRGFQVRGAAVLQFQRHLDGYALAHPSLPAGVPRPQPFRHGDAFTIENNVLTGFTCGGVTIALSCAPARRQQRRLLIRCRRRHAVRPNRVRHHRDWNDQHSGVPRRPGGKPREQ